MLKNSEFVGAVSGTKKAPLRGPVCQSLQISGHGIRESRKPSRQSMAANARIAHSRQHTAYKRGHCFRILSRWRFSWNQYAVSYHRRVEPPVRLMTSRICIPCLFKQSQKLFPFSTYPCCLLLCIPVSNKGSCKKSL